MLVLTFTLLLCALAIPLCAALIERSGGMRMSERRHRHHDSFLIQPRYTRSLMIAMLALSVLAFFFTLICFILAAHGDVFELRRFFTGSPWVWDAPLSLEQLPLMLGFFDSLLLSLFVAWYVLRRYKISVFSSYLVVRPFVGARRAINFCDIQHVRWSGFRMATGYQSLKVYIAGRLTPAACLYGFLDIEKIVQRLCSFGVLEADAVTPR